MRQRKAAVDLWFRGILRCEEVVEFFFRVDDASVRVAEGESAVEEVLLDSVEQGSRAMHEFRHRLKSFFFRSAIAPANRDIAALAIAGTELDAQRHAFFDPLPTLYSAAKVSLIDLHFERRTVPVDRAKLRGEFVSRGEDRVSGFGFRGDWNDDDVCRR